MKLCPFCAEEIQDAAIKCKHCGSTLQTADSTVPLSEPDPIDQEVERLLNRFEKLEAIALMRKRKSLSLEEAKVYVERVERGYSSVEALETWTKAGISTGAVEPTSATVMPPDSFGAPRKTCPSCKEAVRMDASVCPYCRNPLFKTAEAQGLYSVIMLGLVCISLFYFAQSCYYSNEATKQLEKLQRSYP